MAKTLPDLWDGCYDGKARRLMSPEDFRKQFCERCMNAGCRNSKGAGTSWMKRMMTQEDILLNDPQFADPRDPRFKQLAQMDFQDTLREALAIEIADRKGDWSIPTERDIGEAAAELVGLKPTGFSLSNAPEPVGEIVKPPERLVDETVRAKLPPGPKSILNKPPPEDAPLRGQNQVTIQIDDYQEPAPEPEGRWNIRGSKGDIYTVTFWGGEDWDCTCPSAENPCKHARDIHLKLSRAAPQPPAPSQREELRQAPVAPPPNAAPSFRPRDGKNTQVPQDGILLGGGGGEPPIPQEPDDPWAPAPQPAAKERKIPVGGKVRFKKK